MLSLLKSSLSSNKRSVNKRTSILNSNTPINSSRTVNQSYRIMSEFDDQDVVQDTPLSFLIRKIRQLDQLAFEDFELLKCLDNAVLIDLLIEYNYALRFNFALKNKRFA